MLCCNTLFNGIFAYVVQNNEQMYRKIEYGVCPQCGELRFMDYKLYANGDGSIKQFSGREAKTKFEIWKKKLINQPHGTYSNQNVYYGDFKKTRNIDAMGNPIYIQLRKNFNGQTEELNLITTRTYAI